MKQLFTMLIAVAFFTISDGLCQRAITVDFQNEIAPIKDLLGVNRGPNDKLLGYMDGGVTAIRPHDERASDYYFYSDFWNADPVSGAFTSINANFDPTDSTHYEWNDLDEKINVIVENGMDVYFRLGVSWPENANYPRAPIDPPLDGDGTSFSNFAEMCKRTAMHLNGGWDNGFYHNIEYWEVWNEPGGIFWGGSPVQFYRMYEAVSRALKAYDPNLKVGAPGAVPSTIIVPRDEYFYSFLAYVADYNIPLDFYSWHLYGAKNPYGVKYWSDFVRQQLDSLGFTDAESHITEINYQLGDAMKLLENNAAGAAYLLSNLISLQESPVDQIYWYPGLALFDDDDGNAPQYKWNGYGLKSYSLMLNNTPVQVHSSGSQVIEGNWQTDTTNFMVFAGKSENGDKVYAAVSNYNSDYEDYTIEFTNLPWSVSDEIKVTINLVKEPSDEFSEFVSFQPGDGSMSIPVNDMAAPSITLVRLEKQSGAGVASRGALSKQFQLYQNYPNPFNASTTIQYRLAEECQVELAIFDLRGKEVRILIRNKETAGEHAVHWDGKNNVGYPVSTGVYFFRLKTDEDFSQVKKVVYLK